MVIRSRKVGVVRQHQSTNGTQQRQLTDNALTSRTLVVAVDQLHVASAVIGGLLSNSVSIPTVLLSIKGGNPIGCTSDDCFTGGTMMGCLIDLRHGRLQMMEEEVLDLEGCFRNAELSSRDLR